MAHEENKHLLEVLNNCAAECDHCAMACLKEDNVKMLATCIRMDLDCAAICRLTATLVSRSSFHANYLLAECAEACNKCADECDKHSNMEHCMRCAEACRTCAEVCLQPVA